MLPRILIPVAMLGFIATCVAQVGHWTGHDFLGPLNTALFIGIFVVIAPSIYILEQSFPNRAEIPWKAYLLGAPAWRLDALYLIIAYAVVNFLLGFLGFFPTKGSEFYRVGTSHAMVFYFLGWSLNTAALGRIRWGLHPTCAQGHPVAFGVSACATCGSPVPDPAITSSSSTKA